MSWSSSAIRMRKRYWLHSRSICRSAYTILFDDNEAITPITTTTSTFANAINGPTVYIHLPIIWLLVVQMLVLVLILKCYVSTIIFFIFCNNFKFKLQIIILTQIVWVDSDTGTVVTMFRVQLPPSPTPIPTTLVATIATGPIVYGQSLLMSSTGRALLLLLLLSHASWSRELSVPPEI